MIQDKDTSEGIAQDPGTLGLGTGLLGTAGQVWSSGTRASGPPSEATPCPQRAQEMGTGSFEPGKGYYTNIWNN